MALRGRPPKHKEPPVSRSFDLPAELNTELISTSQQTGISQVKIVRDGIKHQLDVTNGKITPNELNLSPITEEIKRTLIETLSQERDKENLLISLREPDRERLETVSLAIGYTNPADLVEDVMRTLLRRPEEITEMLLGQSVRALQKALEGEGDFEAAAAGGTEFQKLNERVAKNQSKKLPRKKAA